ncbi:hypothetical protein LJC60_03665 [Ruminococcaceae bacterium OttesenSCG-928-D13]|nr:hypothetical protein [Ruminococcaceae bacterium OttesenSCG-928-D13]
MAFGAQNGCPFTVEKLDSGDSSQFAVRFAVNGSCKAAAKNLNAQKTTGLRWHGEGDINEGGVLVAIFSPSTDFYARAGFHTLLGAAAAELAAQGLAAPTACPLCGLPGCDSYAYLDGEWRGAHKACLDTRLEVPEMDFTPPRKTRGHLATGMLGALAGAFIGGVLIWTIAMSSGSISWALYAFVPILSGLMYRTCRGKANANLAGLCVLLASLLVTLALEQVWYQVVLSAEVGRNVPFVLSVPTYFRTHSFFSAIKEMLTCLLALLAGFVAVSIFLRRYAGEGLNPVETIRGSRFIRRTAVPIRPDGAENAADDPPQDPPPSEPTEETQP